MTPKQRKSIIEDIEGVAQAIGAWIRSGDGKTATVESRFLVSAEEILVKTIDKIIKAES